MILNLIESVSEGFPFYFFIVCGTLTESMTYPEKREGPYYGIYLFEMYHHIFFFLSY